MSLLTKVAFYPTLLYNILMTQMTNRKWFDRIDETVILGALPLKQITKWLVEKENVRGVVSLTEDFETKTLVNSEEEWRQLGVEQLKLETVDYVGTPTQQNIQTAVDFINKYGEKQESVYVHCKAGRTRSTTVVACYLIQKNGWTPEEAVEYIKTKRPHIWLRDKQLESINIYFDTCQSTKKPHPS